MAQKLNNIPYSIGVPGGAPGDARSISMFLTQFLTALNNWIYQVANVVNNLVLTQTGGVITEVNTGAGLTGGPIDAASPSGTISLVTPVSTADGGTGSSSGITLTGDVTGGPAAPSIGTLLATVNSNVGSYTNANITVNGKGLVTAAANGSGSGLSGMTAGQLPVAATATTITSSIPYGTSGASTIVETNTSGYLAAGVMPALTGDVTSTAGGVATVLATVNSDTGTINGVTTNGKGLVTANVAQGYWVADADWSFSSHNLIGNLSGGSAPAIINTGLEIVGANSTNAGAHFQTFAANPTLAMQRADGTVTAPSGLVAGDIFVSLIGRGYTSASAYSTNAAVMTFNAAETWSGSATGSYIDFTTTPLTTVSPAVQLRIQGSGGLSVPATSTDTGAGTINVSAGYYVGAKNIQTGKAAGNTTVASPGSVTATSPTYKMLGLAGTVTTVFNAKAMLSITGSLTDATLADVITLVLSYGTGVAPGNGTALAGTQIGSTYKTEVYVASDSVGFCLTAIIPATVGTATWLDLAVGSSGGHAVTFGSTNVAVMEV